MSEFKNTENPGQVPEKRNKMGTMPVRKLLFSMSVPAMFSMLINALYNIVDSIFVSMVGNSALTAVSLVFPIQMLMIAVSVGTGIGLNSLIARRLGEKKQKEADSAASHGFLLFIISAFIFTLFGIFFSEIFIRSFSNDTVIAGYGTSYCFIVTTFCIFLFIQVCCEKIMQATGNMLFPMIGSLVGAISNIILDPILIFGMSGMPKLGIAGAAIATVIGQFLGMLCTIIFLFGFKHQVNITFREFHFHLKTVRNIYSVGLPSMVMQAIGSVMLVGLNAILIIYSDIAVAVLGVYFKLQSFVFMPVFGLNQGTMPIIGYNYGARNKDRLLHTFRLSMGTALIIMALGTLIFQIFPAQLMMMFNASDEMLHMGIRALRLISLCFIPAAIGIICSTLFQAIGHGMISLLISLLRQLFLILPLAYFLAIIVRGVDYVWLAFPFAEIFSVIASIYFYKKIYREEILPLDESSSSSKTTGQ